MADPVLGLGPNLNAYRAALQRPNQGQQMVHVARDVARTLGVAFNNVPMPVGNAPTRRERDILRLREAIEQMIQALSSAVKDGGFDGIVWSDTSGQNFIAHLGRKCQGKRMQKRSAEPYRRQLLGHSLAHSRSRDHTHISIAKFL